MGWREAGRRGWEARRSGTACTEWGRRGPSRRGGWKDQCQLSRTGRSLRSAASRRDVQQPATWGVPLALPLSKCDSSDGLSRLAMTEQSRMGRSYMTAGSPQPAEGLAWSGCTDRGPAGCLGGRRGSPQPVSGVTTSPAGPGQSQVTAIAQRNYQ